MTRAFLALGDTATPVARGVADLDSAHRLAEGECEPPRAVLAFADLREDSRQSGRERLKALSTLAAVETKRHSAIRQIVFAVMLAPRHAGAFDRIASGLGARVHADLERDKARDVEITFLDVSDCRDVAALTGRLLDRCDDPVGQHGVVVLDWDDIRDRSIRHAARDQYL